MVVVDWERGPQTPWVLPRAVWQLGQEAWAHGGQEETEEVSAAPSGYTQLPVSAGTSFQKQSLSFLTTFPPTVTHFCSGGPTALRPSLSLFSEGHCGWES